MFLMMMTIAPIFASDEEVQGTQVFVVSGKVDKAYQWILNNPNAVVKVSKNGSESEARVYAETTSYAKVYISFSGYVAKSGDEISVGVCYDALKIWSKSYKVTPEDIAQASCTVNIDATSTEDKTQLIVVGGHIDETIQDLLPATIIVDLNGVQVPATIHENNTYTATFMVFEGYVAGVSDTVNVVIEKNGVKLFSKKHTLTQTEINEKACIIDLQLASTVISPRKICHTTWGAVKR